VHACVGMWVCMCKYTNVINISPDLSNTTLTRGSTVHRTTAVGGVGLISSPAIHHFNLFDSTIEKSSKRMQAARYDSQLATRNSQLTTHEPCYTPRPIPSHNVPVAALHRTTAVGGIGLTSSPAKSLQCCSEMASTAAMTASHL
jgi:hypothetical protein